MEYYDKYDAVKVQRELNKTIIDSNEILVEGECERLLHGWIPRRLGKFAFIVLVAYVSKCFIP